MGDILQIGGAQWLRLHPDTPALNMALVTKVEPFADSDNLAVYTLFRSSPEIYKGDYAERIRLWLAKHGELPALGVGSSHQTET